MEHNILRSRSWWGKSIAAGLIGGLVMGIYVMSASALVMLGFFYPANVFAATFEAFRPPFEGFNASATTTGLLLHFITAAFWGAVFAVVAGAAPRMVYRMGRTIFTGLLYGVLVWLIMGLMLGPAMDPAITTLPGGNWFLSHLVYGVGTAWALHAFTRQKELAWALRHEPRGAEGAEGIRVNPS